MENRAGCPPAFVDGPVERQLGGRRMHPLDNLLPVNAHDVRFRQRALVRAPGVIQMSPDSSRIEMFPPEVVVMPYP